MAEDAGEPGEGTATFQIEAAVQALLSAVATPSRRASAQAAFGFDVRDPVGSMTGWR